MKKQDIKDEVTNNIIDLLENVNPDDYQSPFAGMASQGIPFNPTTSNYYKGVNVLSLWFNQQEREFSTNQWATFKQWKESGAQVKKGEKASRVIFYKTLTFSEESKDGEMEEQKIPMLRAYPVFNAAQVEGYNLAETKPSDLDLVNRSNLIDEFCQNSKAEIRHSSEGRAYYQKVHDFIHMPETKLFHDTNYASATENYYATLLHELTHWTGASHRLNRDKAKVQGERDKIAFEELVAELGAAFLCAQFNLKQSKRDGHVIYIKSWLQALKNDTSYIFKAAAKAGQALDFLNDLNDKNHAPEI